MDELRITPRLGDDRPLMESTCGFGLPSPSCTRPATWHVFWDERDNSLTCDEHMAYAQGFAYFDRHPLTEVCTVPEVTVVWSWEDVPGYCQWVVSEETHAMAVAAERETVETR